MKYSIEQFPKNKIIKDNLSEYQIELRDNQKFYIYKNKKTCKKCLIKMDIKEFYIADNKTKRRKNSCRDCQMNNAGVIEIGKQRYAYKILEKGFKRCSICKDTKLISDFSKSKSCYKGINNSCYSCSKKLSSRYVKESNKEITLHYIKQFAKRKNIKFETKKDIENVIKLIKKIRTPKYFIDNKGFIRLSDFCRYMLKIYNQPISRTAKRINDGKSEEECKMSTSQMRVKYIKINKAKKGGANNG